jgi:hypothetical protein
MSRMTKRSAAAAAAAAIASSSINESSINDEKLSNKTAENTNKQQQQQEVVIITKQEELDTSTTATSFIMDEKMLAAELEAVKEIRKANNPNPDEEDDDDDEEEDEDHMEEDEEFIGHDLELEDDDDEEEEIGGGNGSSDNSGLNKSKTNKSATSAANKKSESEKLRRRLPMSVKELIDYHSSNGKSIKEIVNKINVVCRTDEKVSYGYVQKYLYRKKLEATTAKKARYYRKKYGFVYRRMRRKPVLTENHRASRIQWCLSHQNDHFDQDIFIGKTALKPFLASLNQLKGTPADPNQPRQQTTLHLWGAISRKGASPLQVKQHYFKFKLFYN